MAQEKSVNALEQAMKQITESQLRAALTRATVKLARQEEACQATRAEIAMFEAQLAQKLGSR